MEVAKLPENHPFVNVYNALNVALIDKNDLFETLKKSQEQLEISFEAAKAADIAKSQFLANMSHEIRTPMNAIVGFSQLLKMTTLDEEQHTYVSEMTLASEMLLSLINDILDFSKIEAGKLRLENIEFNIINVLNEVVSQLKLKAKEKDIALNLDILETFDTELFGDPMRVKQIFINLVGNAVKFTLNGNVTIRVDKFEETSDTISLKFSVSDTGIGMDENTVANLFRTFMQADSSTTRNFGGTGLGLSITKQLVDLMNGKIEVESQLHKGSIFTVFLKFPKKQL